MFDLPIAMKKAFISVCVIILDDGLLSLRHAAEKSLIMTGCLTVVGYGCSGVASQ